MEDIDAFVFYDKPLLKFERILEVFLATVPKGFKVFRKAMPIWLREKLFLKDLIAKQFREISQIKLNEKFFLLNTILVMQQVRFIPPLLMKHSI